MGYDTKHLLRDAGTKIAPQAFDVSADAYRVLTGQDLGGGRFGMDGIQWGKTASGLFVPIAVADDGAVKVEQTGTVVRDIMPRSVYSTSQGFQVEIPTGATSVYVLLQVVGVTGTFSEGEGIELRTGLSSSLVWSQDEFRLTSAKMQSAGPAINVYANGANLGEASVVRGGKLSGVLAGDYLVVNIGISGTNPAFDARCVVVMR